MSDLNQIVLNVSEGDLHLMQPDPYPEILIQREDGWLMKITKDNKIAFNQEQFPDMAVDEFAKEVIKILEQSMCHFR